ncbi:hypothetical protein ABPG75_010637 [Micractinium tetrahymenae]
MPAPAAATIADLPDELLARCLEPLDQQERLQSAALVCKKFCRVCAALPLHVAISTLQRNGQERLRPRLQALRAFLAKHTPPVASLQYYSWSEGAAGQEEVSVLTACLGLCTSLEQLDFASSLPLPDSSLPGLLLGLRQLKVNNFCSAALRLPECITRLTALAELEAAGSPVEFEGPALLPGLTYLFLRDDDSTQLPRQLSSLRSLASLVLDCCLLEAGSLAPLENLPALTSLRFIAETPVPAGLGALTSCSSCSSRAFLRTPVTMRPTWRPRCPRCAACACCRSTLRSWSGCRSGWPPCPSWSACASFLAAPTKTATPCCRCPPGPGWPRCAAWLRTGPPCRRAQVCCAAPRPCSTYAATTRLSQMARMRPRAPAGLPSGPASSPCPRCAA